MAFTTGEKDGRRILKIEGPMTIYEAVDIRDELSRHFEAGGDFNLGLENVTECDTAGVQLLCAAGRTGREEGKAFCIESPSRAVVEAIAEVGLSMGDLGVVE
jgi:anti-sigma B factor antagonist